MKVKELMIGNFIYCKTDKGTKVGRIDSLQEISKYAFFVAVKTADGVDYACKINNEYNSIAPIPITIEWLVKNGFEKRYEDICDYYYYSKEIGDCLYRIEIKFGLSNTSEDHVVCYIDNSDCQTFCNADIQYIHQLQNLLNILNVKEEFIV